MKAWPEALSRRGALLALALLAALPATGQPREERVRVASGGAGTVVEGSIAGDAIVDYLFAAAEGQRARIAMTADNASAYFNLLPPEGETALFVGSISGKRYRGELPATGEYRVRVYLMRNAARRGETASYRLELALADGDTAADALPASPEDGGPRRWQVTGVSGGLNLREGASTSAPVLGQYAPGTVLDNLGCRRAEGRVWCDVQETGGGPRGYVAAEYLAPAGSPDGGVATGPDDSALRAGRGDFDATGEIPCAQVRGQPTAPCPFGVARAGGGDATVVVTRPDGTDRAIFFADGAPIGADTSEADPGAFQAEREGDLNLIRVGEERYEIPDAVALGG